MKWQTYAQESEAVEKRLAGLQEFVDSRWRDHHPLEIARLASSFFKTDVSRRLVWMIGLRLDANRRTRDKT